MILNSLLVYLRIARLGENNRDNDIDCENNRCLEATQEYNVDMLFKHRLYDPKDFSNDIGMLRLERRVEYTCGLSGR